MIPNNTRETKTEGNLGGRKFKGEFSKDALPFMMQVLTNLYGDNVTTVIREYSTNARDAHIDANKRDVPIRVKTPTVLDPYLRIKDEGVGLNADDVENMYRFYGDSTKRQQTETNGSMGLGSKSGLAFAPQFNMVCIKAGVKTLVAVSAASDGGIDYEIVSETPTDEGNGVEIVIPMSISHGAQRKAANFFRYWDKGM